MAPSRTPSPSPSDEGSAASPTLLTPRSKIKALLAAVDDSDDEVITRFTRKAQPAKTNSTTASPAKDALDTASTDGETEDEEVVFKPRGRMVARMLTAQTDGEADGDDEQEGETARDRVRRLLSKKAASPVAEATENDPRTRTETVSPPRSSRATSEAASAPYTPNNGGRDGLFVSPSPEISSRARPDASDSENDLPTNPGANARFLALVAKKREERLAREAEQKRLKAERAAAAQRQSSKNQSSTLSEDDVSGSDEDGSRKLTQQARPTRKASKKAIEEMHRETQRMSRNMQLTHEARTKKKITKSSLFARFNYKPEGWEEEEAQKGEVVEAQATSSSPARRTDAEVDTPPTSPAPDMGEAGKLHELETQIQTTDADVFAPIETMAEDDYSAQQEEDLPPFPEPRKDKGKGKAIEEPILVENAPVQVPKVIRPLRILPPKNITKTTHIALDSDSDSDLEILPTLPPQTSKQQKLDSIFARIPEKQSREPHSLLTLRALAHLTSPGKQRLAKNAKPSMTATELGMTLQQRARQQAAREREERLNELRARGVVVQTAEEKEKENALMEDLMEKARLEAEEIARREKKARKKAGKGDGDEEEGDDSEDSDWEEEKEKFKEQMEGSGDEEEMEGEEAEFSGSEEDDGEDDDEVEGSEEEEAAEQKLGNTLIDGEAEESDTEEDEGAIIPSSQPEISNGVDTLMLDDDEEASGPTTHYRRRAQHMVVSDDEDEDDERPVPPTPAMLHIQSPAPRQTPGMLHTESPAARLGTSPMAPPSVLRSATKTFIPGLPVAAGGPAGLGLTQIFQGTMDDSQSQQLEDTQVFDGPPTFDAAQDSLTFLRKLPRPEPPVFAPTFDEESQEIVRDSQTQVAPSQEVSQTQAISQAVDLHFSQTEVHGFDSMLDPLATQMSHFQPTQDVGFQDMTPIQGRYFEPPPSTVDTVIVERPVTDIVAESPVAKKKGRLVRRTEIVDDADQEGDTHVGPTEPQEDYNISNNLFDVMRKASKKLVKPVDDFDKKKSAAKEMVEEQAEESEDEYAGLGGASDDESGGEDDALVKAMIDDEEGKDVDESKLAALFADKERKRDEKQLEKIFNDITKGMLRHRKRGADYDLSDSDDGGEARRRRKRREFAKIRNAILEDERLGKIAENPKKMAFLRAIEDRDEEDEIGFLDDLGEPDDEPISSGESQDKSQVESSQKEVDGAYSKDGSPAGSPKRKRAEDAEPGKRLPPHLRRIMRASRPSNLADIRKTISNLTEDPNAMFHSSTPLVSESEGEDETSDTERSQEKDKENRDPFAARRRPANVAVDRILLKQSSSLTASSATTRLAFAAPSSTPLFKVPALLKRTTTNLSLASTTSTGTTTGTERAAGCSGFGGEGKGMKKAGKNSGVNYFARENERRAKMEETLKKRNEKRLKSAEGRRKVVGGLFAGGKFE